MAELFETVKGIVKTNDAINEAARDFERGAEYVMHCVKCHDVLLDALREARFKLYGNLPHGNAKIDSAIKMAEQFDA
jgi:hypothetical protein